jgi:phage-related protein
MANEVKVTLAIAPVIDEASLSKLKATLSSAMGKTAVSIEKIISGGLTATIYNIKSHLSSASFAIKSKLAKIFDDEDKLGSHLTALLSKLNQSQEKSGAKARSGIERLIGGAIGLLGQIASAVMSLKPVQKMISAISSLFQMIFLPIGLILMAFLMPVLQGLAQVLSSKIFEKIMIATSNFLKWVTALDIPSILGTALSNFWNWMVGGLTTFFGGIGTALGEFKSLVVGRIDSFINMVKEAYAVLQAGVMRVVDGLETLWGYIDGGIKFVVGIFSPLFGILVNGVKFLGNLLMVPLNAIMSGINFVMGIFSSFWGFIQNPIQMVVSFLQMISNGINSFIGVVHKLNPANDVKSAVSSVGNAVSNAVSGVFSGIAHLASGGTIVSSGLAVVHKGETVVPAGKTMGGESQQNSFHIEIHVHGVTDPRELADRVQKEFESRTGRMLRWSS